MYAYKDENSNELVYVPTKKQSTPPNQVAWSEQKGKKYLKEIGVPFAPDGTPLGIGWGE